MLRPMRRKIIAGVTLLAVGAVADVIWVKTRHHHEGVTLIVHGAGPDCTIALTPEGGERRTAPCTGDDVKIEDLAPAEYQLCVDARCVPTTIRTTPAVQMLDVSLTP
jgi:hypothetical protein